ncbi:DUF6370 family protein [Flavobacterium gyeonganense]|uniref:DUF6370 family protein n=1 Tax=Flavobacterium gyeonganense TaxID=1310418 RepID=A0ABV5HA68_9FLAO|nr:DUF6370 family protein [Flavobacterium gyeonganense]
MKNILLATFLFIGIAVQAQSKKKFDKPTIVEASCGECQFAMKGKSCDLAVRIDGKSYFVDGTTIHDHGDAHAEKGFCNAISKALVTGEIVNNRFKATSFKLIEEKK